MSLIIGAVQEKWVFPDYFAFLDLAVSLGFKWVEFKYEIRLDPDGQLLQKAARLQQLAKKSKVGVSIHAPYEEEINLGSINQDLLKKTRQRVQTSIEFAQRLQAKYVTVHGGFLDLGYQLSPGRECTTPPFELVREALGTKVFAGLKERIIEEVGALQAFAKKKGVLVALENLHGFGYDKTRFPITPEDFKECQKALGTDLMLVYDSGHANATGLSALEFISAVGLENIVGAHIHDNDGTQDQHLPLGQGNIDFAPFPKIFQNSQVKIPLNLELRSKEHFIHSKAYMQDLLKSKG